MVGEGEDRLFQESLLDFREGDFMVHGPLPLGVLMSEGKQGFGKVRKSRNELSIEVAESNEGSDCFYVSWGIPVFDGIEFGWVHFYGSWGDEEAKIFDLGGVEGAFGGF